MNTTEHTKLTRERCLLHGARARPARSSAGGSALCPRPRAGQHQPHAAHGLSLLGHSLFSGFRLFCLDFVCLGFFNRFYFRLRTWLGEFLLLFRSQLCVPQQHQKAVSVLEDWWQQKKRAPLNRQCCPPEPPSFPQIFWVFEPVCVSLFLFCKEWETIIFFKSIFWKRMYVIRVKSYSSRCVLLLWFMLRNNGKTEKT